MKFVETFAYLSIRYKTYQNCGRFIKVMKKTIEKAENVSKSREYYKNALIIYQIDVKYNQILDDCSNS